MSDRNGLEIAVIGLSGRFPGASSIDAFWDNLCAGRESIVHFTDDELAAAGVPREQFARAGYVKANGKLADIDAFDADFFQISAAEARAMCPQHRIFLMCCWEALEHAGYDPSTYPGGIGVYAGSGYSYYFLNLLQNPRLAAFNPATLSGTNFDKDFLATRVAYKLNLRGPAVAVQTACSTSLVSIHLACQALLAGECDLALAGGVTVRPQQTVGYQYSNGSVLSSDGHCRAFDAAASGTVGGSGAGVVVLKRLDAALNDRDHIFAIVRGTAINNDGGEKVGFAAPGASGQTRAIRQAFQVAGVEPASISYVEAHGTGTTLGDPVEVQALAEAFDGAGGSPRTRPCALGSVKTNVGHLDAAAGVAGFIKTVLALHHRTLPASLNFAAPNPKIDFTGNGFVVNTRTHAWPDDSGPRRAGVSAFGIGGTNAHAILEEAPPVAAPTVHEFPQLLVVSGRTARAADAAVSRLGAYFAGKPSLSLADVGFTLQVGRKAFAHRRTFVCRNLRDASEQFGAQPAPAGATPAVPPSGIVFSFPELKASNGFSPAFQRLCAWDRTLAGWRDECMADAPPGTTSVTPGFVYPWVEQMVLARLWARHLGTPAGVTATGSGALAAAVLAGRASVAEALRRAAAAEFCNTPHLPTPEAGADPLVVEIGLAPTEGGAVRSDATGRLVRSLGTDSDAIGAWLQALGNAWRAGAAVNWGDGLGDPPKTRVPLPTYPFETQSYWLDPEVPAPRPAEPFRSAGDSAPRAAGTTVYEACWAEVPVAAFDHGAAGRAEWVCVGADDGLARRLQSAAAAQGCRCTCGEAIQPAELAAVAQRARATGVAPIVVYAGVYANAANDTVLPPWAFEQPLASVQASVAALRDVGFTFVLLTRNLFPVSGGEVTQPAQALAHGVALTLAREFPAVRCLTVDVDDLTSRESDRRGVLAAIMAEALGSGGEAVVAYRFGRRWTRQFVPLPAARAAVAWPIKEGAVCAITGGLGGLGFELARRLVAQHGAKVALMGRSSAAQVAADPVRRARLEELVRMSADVRYYSADTAEPAALAEAWRQVQAELGPVEAVFHLAGAGHLKAIPALDRAADRAAILQPKVGGAETLIRLATRDEASLVVLFSSLSGVAGAGNQLEYVAANAYLDAKANALAVGAGPHVLSVAWAGWRDIGMRHELLKRAGAAEGTDVGGLSTDEALAALGTVLRAGRANTFVCDADIRTKLAGLVSPVPAPQSPAESNGSPTGGPVEPDQVRAIVREVWQKVIGNDSISDDDDFYALGGDSLNAAVIANRLVAALPQAGASVQDVLTHATVATLAAVLTERLGAVNAAASVSAAAAKGTDSAALESYLRTHIQDILARQGRAEPTDERHAIVAAAGELAGRLKQDHRFECHPGELLAAGSIAALAGYLAKEMRAMDDYVPSSEPFSFIDDEPPGGERPARRIPGPALVLSAPRCGSTLLRLMLRRHPTLFCPPELGLLSYDTPAEFAGHTDEAMLRGGVLLCLEEALGCDRETAHRTWEGLLRGSESNQALFAAVQTAAAPRLLVEKTAGYAGSRSALGRAESWFDGTKYVCLVRHPFSAIESFVRKRFYRLHAHASSDPYLLAERLWSTSYRNILELAHQFPARTCFVRYEDLMAAPETELGRLCDFLGCEFVPEMLHPYGDDTVRFGVGDPDIHRHSRIDAGLGDNWRRIVLPRPLARETTDLAAHFGYELSA